MVLVVAVLGRSGSGKTVTIEYLISQFSVEGYSVGAVKHIHRENFTIDTEGKNTWRYAQAGAKVVAAVSPQEIALIKKTRQELQDIDQIIETLKKEQLDIIFFEGYHNLIAKRSDIVKIVAAKNMETLKETLSSLVEPIIAVAGLVAKNTYAERLEGLPVIRIPEDGKKLVELIKKLMIKTA